MSANPYAVNDTFGLAHSQAHLEDTKGLVCHLVYWIDLALAPCSEVTMRLIAV